MAVSRMKRCWKELVGAQIAAHTCPMEIRFSTLTIQVDTSVWRHQLTFLKKEVIQKVNLYLKEEKVNDIHFRVGPLPVSLQQSVWESGPFRRIQDDTLEESIENKLLSIQDEELRGIIRGAILQYTGV